MPQQRDMTTGNITQQQAITTWHVMMAPTCDHVTMQPQGDPPTVTRMSLLLQ